MKSILLGGFVVGGLVAIQSLMRLLRTLRLKRLWAEAQEALQNHDLVRAERALRACVARMPLWMPARVLLGLVCARQGNLADAEAHIKMAIEFHPRQHEGYLQLGLFYAMFCPDRAEDAIAALTSAVDLAPSLRETLGQETRLAALRQHPGFKQLLFPPPPQ